MATSTEVPSFSSAAVAAAIPVTAAMLGPVKCSWTEHTSPDGFKYYYNSVTGESRVRGSPFTLFLHAFWFESVFKFFDKSFSGLNLRS